MTGRLDIVASNWGRNSKYSGTVERPWRLYYGDLGRGEMDLVEARLEPTLGKEAPERSWRMVRAALPFLQERIQSYEAYGQAGVAEIYGHHLKSMRAVEVTTAATMVLFNRGDHFEAVELAAEAQWAPSFGICVADADGDGAEDIFLSQNFFAMNPETARQDSGRGLWLRGDGKGGLTPLPGELSGVKVYGEQRGCAVGDFDGDGRVDLLVAQNGAATRLFKNVGATPGLRVRLNAGPENVAGIGAALRLVYAKSFGPLREVHAGSGYWSQDGAVQVLGKIQEPSQIWVRWPGGKTNIFDVPPGTREMSLDISIGAKRLR